jgi:hypothetical protein
MVQAEIFHELGCSTHPTEICLLSLMGSVRNGGGLQRDRTTIVTAASRALAMFVR